MLDTGLKKIYIDVTIGYDAESGVGVESKDIQ